MSTATTTEAWTDDYFTVSDGTKLHFVEMGAGTPVVLIHGAGGSAVGNWFRNGIAPALAPTNRVIGIDMRGHALSEAGPDEGRRNMPKDVLEFLDQQGIDRAHIGGYSMGGGVTAALLAMAPERFITASFGGAGVMETEDWADKLPEDKPTNDPEAAQASAAYAAARASRGEEVGNGAGMRRGAGGAAAQLTDEQRAARRRRSAPAIDFSKVTFPVLAVNGEFDRPFAKTHRLWRECTNFTNVILPGKGHLSAVMEGFIPKAYIDAMVQFITFNNP